MRKIILSICAVSVMLFASVSASAAGIDPPRNSDMAKTPDITRVRFCELAYEVLELKTGIGLTDKTDIFSDTDSAQVCTLASLGIISGRGGGIFDPDGLITREEAAKILCLLMDNMGIPDMNIVDEHFRDIDSVSDWAREYVERVGRNEIMQGNGDGYVYDKGEGQVNEPYDSFHLYNSDFGPDSNYTVWQTQKTLYNIYYLLPEKNGYETAKRFGDVTFYWGQGRMCCGRRQGHSV